jgi:hypothetical protein
VKGKKKPQRSHGLSRKLEYKMWGAAKHRAKKKGIPFDLLPEDIKIPNRCPLLGIKLVAHRDRVQFDSPSLDRLVPRLGYVRGNVLVISNRANVLKNDGTLPELVMLVGRLSKIMNEK